MAIALVAHVSGNSTGSSFTTSGIDTTGATLLVANATYFNTNTSGQLTDSKGNSWTPLPRKFSTDAAGQVFYCVNPVVGSSHTFTITAGNFSSLQVAAFSGVTGVAPADVTASATGSSNSATGGSVTPTNTNSLVISACTARNTGNISSVNGGFTITDNVSTGSVIDGAIGYLIQTSIAAANPAWSLSGSINWCVTNVVFIAGSSVPPVTPAIVASVNKDGGSGTNTVTSSAIDTTGATLIVISQSAFTSLGTISDSKGNTWTALTSRTGVNAVQRLYYAANPTVGSGHTFTATNIVSGSFQVIAFSGVALLTPFDVENGTSGTGDAQFGSVTPSVSGSLIVSGLAYTNNSQEVLGIDTGFKIVQLDPTTGAPASVIGGAIAFKISSVAENPKWFFSGTSLASAANNAVFKPTSGALTQTLSDTLSLSDALTIISPILGTTLSDSLSFSDDLIVTLAKLVSQSDSLTLSDLVASTLGMILSEGFTLSDVLNYGLSLPISGSDSLTLSDLVTFLIGIGIGKTDTITLSDVLNLGADVKRMLGDNILFSDFLVTLLAGLPAYSDNFNLSDSARLSLSLGISSTDSLALSDAVQLAVVNNLILTKSDSLSLSDEVSVNLSGPIDQYIRHWLNDVPR